MEFANAVAALRRELLGKRRWREIRSSRREQGPVVKTFGLLQAGTQTGPLWLRH